MNRNIMTYRKLVLVSVLLLGAIWAQFVPAMDSANGEAIKIDVSGTVSMISSGDRNISISSGSDGLLIIEDHNTAFSPQVSNMLKTLGKDRPAFIIDTRFNSSPTNEKDSFRNSGAIIAHESIEDRLNYNQEKQSARPIIAYDRELKVYFNDEKISIIHLSAGQSADDSIVLFTTSNVAYLGYHFWNGKFPHIDLERGDSLRSYTLAVAECLSLVSDSMKIIPGRGSVATKMELENFYRMLNLTVTQVKDQIKKDLSLEQIIEKGLGDEWKSWGTGEVSERDWISLLYSIQVD